MAEVRLLPCGDTAVLVELADRDERRRLDAALRARPLPGSTEHVPADRTVLVRFAAADAQRVVDALRALDLDAAASTIATTENPLVVPVRYDGPDLAGVAEQLGIPVAEVVRRHTAASWRVEFAGFSPGFGYLLADDAPAGSLDVPRLDTPRTRVPAGAVALAGAYSGIYPSASPGGWRLIGSTALAVWDPARTPPALLTPGRAVCFEETG